MRKPHLAAQRDVRAAIGAPLAVAGGQRRPLADAVGGQDRGAARRRGEKRGGRVRGVMIGEEDLLSRGTPSCDEMMPRTQTFSPSVFLIACGNDRHERGNARSAHVRMRSNFSMLRS